MRIAIRVDAATSMGLGHLKRCLSLAHALRDAGTEVAVLTACLDIDVSAIVQRAGFECIQFTPIPASDGIREGVASARLGSRTANDAEQSIEALRAWNPQWVIVDHYGLDAHWHQQVSRSLNVRIAVIDDLADRPLVAQLVVDHNFSENHRAKYKDRLSGSTEILGGPRFALLGAAYSGAIPYQFHEDVRSIGIFMGGTDPIDASSVALIACRKHAEYKGPIEVATTGANPHFAALATVCAQWPGTTLLVDQEELSGFFARHDLQIGAGGGATWERCCMGAPTLAMICADNQKVVVPALHRLGVLDTTASLSCPEIGQAVRRLIHDARARQQLSEASRRLVDGHGAQRVALAMLRDQLTVRPARMADALPIFKWRNDSATRQTSHDSAEIPWEIHEKWVERSLVNPQRHLLIAEIGKRPVGVIRFDLNRTEAEISLYLDPALHGLGLGKALLRAGEASALAHWDTLQAFTAQTLEHNIGSQRLFMAAQYEGDHRRFRKVSASMRHIKQKILNDKKP
jgi:UDP-2,4-diacetamido-2,4,6-trideoxy-beta-L-altropyranose hydrolase